MLSFEPVKIKDEVLDHATVRDFSGGYNVLDSDINLSTKYATKLYNCYHSAGNVVKVRYGTEYFVDLRAATTDPTSYPINLEYYTAALVVVMSNGEILSVLADRTIHRIWDITTANALPGSPAAWSATEFASFEQFNGELIICNGVDKPLIVNADLSVDYLQDLGTGSNLNVPIAKYVTTVNRYLVMSGDPQHPNRIHISSQDTSGTWYGDPDPNDGTFIDVGSSLRNASVVKGIRGFRGKLVIAFEEGSILADLGIYDADGNHVPDVSETVQQYGSVSHRSMLDFGDDMLMMDGIGVPSMKRTVFSGTIRPERVSDLVDSEMAHVMEQLDTASLEDRCFAVYDQREGIFMFFIPNHEDRASTTETVAYTYLYRPALKAASWARFNDMNWTCGARTLQGNVFFGSPDGKLYLYGSAEHPVFKDKLNDPAINGGEGVDIAFTWELPWSDMNNRAKLKKSRFIGFDTTGTGTFDVSMYVDRITQNSAMEDAPLLSMSFTGGDVIGYGGASSPFGGGRITSDEHLYKWPAKFKLMKLKISGTVADALEFAAITMYYQKGKVFR